MFLTQSLTQDLGSRSQFGRNPLKKMARPERFELPTYGFEVRRSIQLSYGRAGLSYNSWGRTEYRPGRVLQGDPVWVDGARNCIA